MLTVGCLSKRVPQWELVTRELPFGQYAFAYEIEEAVLAGQRPTQQTNKGLEEVLKSAAKKLLSVFLHVERFVHSITASHPRQLLVRGIPYIH